MKIFKTYQWKNHQLQKKARLYDRLTLIAMALVIVCLFLVSEYITLLLLVVAAVPLLLSWRIKNKDMKLKKPKS